MFINIKKVTCQPYQKNSLQLFLIKKNTRDPLYTGIGPVLILHAAFYILQITTSRGNGSHALEDYLTCLHNLLHWTQPSMQACRYGDWSKWCSGVRPLRINEFDNVDTAVGAFNHLVHFDQSSSLDVLQGQGVLSQILADKLTLSEPGGADYAHQMILSSPDFQTFLRP